MFSTKSHPTAHLQVRLSLGLLFVAIISSRIDAASAHKDGGNLFGQIRDKILTDTANNVFDFVFGDPEDPELKEHEIEHHYYYLKDKSLPDLVSAVGIKNSFFLNFKAHDYDNNDRIDGLELFELIWHEKSTNTHAPIGSPQERDSQMALVSQLIDRLLQEEDTNGDGYLDFTEYSNARLRLETEHRQRA